MVSAPRCRPGARGLLALLLLLPLAGARGLCGALPKLVLASPHGTNGKKDFPIGAQVTYRCLDNFVKIPGKSDTVVCLENLEWSTFGEFCNGGCGAPPKLKSAILREEDRNKNYCPRGTTVSYVCRPGYESTELRLVITCLENLTWSEAPEFCRAKSCGVPKGPEHGRAVVLTNDLFGARANIICDEGFRLCGRPFIQCLPKGDQVEWSQPPTCQERLCKQLELENGRVDLTNLRFGAKANFSCDEGYRLIGTTSAQCVVAENGVNWDKELPHCQAQCRRRRDTNGKAMPYGCDDGSGKSHAITCSPPPNITNGTHNGSNVEIFVYNSSVTYECDHNFSLTGEASIHCTTKDNINGVWNGSAPECKGPCDSPPRLSFAELPGVVNNSYPVGTELKYSCRPGYVLGSEKSPLVTCLANSTWSVDPEFCVGIPCKQLELENGRVHLTDHRVGATATFSCNEGYRLIGTTSAQCVVAENGVNWDKELPHCQVIITQNKPTTVPPEGAEVTGTSSVIITQDKPTTVPPERAEVAGTSSDSALNTAGNSAEPEVEVTITQDKPTTVPPERAEVAGTSSDSALNTAGNSAEPEVEGPDIDRRIGIAGIGPGIIGIIIAVVIVVVIIIVILIRINNIGILTALNKIWQKKKGFYSVNPGCPKHQITTEHDSHLNESKCNLIFKV